MNQPTFWASVADLRQRGKIERKWTRGDLRDPLEGRFKVNTINSLPSNYSISRDGDEIGHSVKNGGTPKAWRVGEGQFMLVEDPDDDVETQDAQKRLAAKRANELRESRIRHYGHQNEAAAPVTYGLDQLDLQSEMASGSPDTGGDVMSASDRYPGIGVTLTEWERQAVAGLRTTEKKALHIVRKHLKDRYGDRAEIEEDREGADLRVSVDGKTERIEVKGTESPTIAWPQLKVSSQRSHDALVGGGASVYRVVDVSSANPRIYVLTYGRHFTLEPERRWAVKRVPPEDDRYPLRGEPYRYDRPYEPAAAGEWETVE